MYNDEDRVYRILGIDPGVNTLGVSILDYTGGDALNVVAAFTIKTEELLSVNPQTGEVLGVRGAKLLLIEHKLLDIMLHFQPEMVASEAPFLGRFPQAYAALVECMVSIRKAYYAYKPHLKLTAIDPPTVKMAVSVYARSNNKDDMTKAVREYPGLILNDIDYDSLDEHSIDAIAVAICKHRFLQGTATQYVKKSKRKKGKRKKVKEPTDAEIGLVRL